MNSVEYQLDYCGLRIEVYRDRDPENPFDGDWDHGFGIEFGHKRYNFPTDMPEHLPPSICEREEWLNQTIGEGKWSRVYMYDHGGLAFSRASFASKFDSGMLGWIWVKEHNPKIDPMDLIDQFLEHLCNYYEGSCYGYKIFDDDKPEGEKEIDSCWGYFGCFDVSGCMMKDAKSAAYAYSRRRDECDPHIILATLPLN